MINKKRYISAYTNSSPLALEDRNAVAEGSWSWYVLVSLERTLISAA